MSKEIKIPSELSSVRVDKYLAENLTEYSRSYIAKMLEEGQILVNGNTVKSSYKLNPLDVITINDIEIKEVEIVSQNIPLDILYEDSDVIVINKPKGMVVHPDNVHKDNTLVNALMYHCNDLSGINGVLRPGIVHRIDMDTTGSIIACKNDFAHESIAEQLAKHSLNRTYLAIVHGVIKEDSGRINLPIGRDEKNRLRMGINYRNGKEAITNFKVLERFNDFTLVECKLETGRTHQIRVHLSHKGYPLLGDSVYSNRKCPYPNYVNGQCLHAYKLGFIHPRSEEYIETVAPIPEYFEKILNLLRSR